MDDYLETEVNINKDLEILSQLAKGHNLALNSSKCYILLFGSSNKINFLENNLNITIDNGKLTFVNSSKNLGLLLDVELRFKEHLKKLLQRAYLALKLLYNNKHILNVYLKKNLCESLVMSHFNYGDFIYGFCLDLESRLRIQKVQNACVRFIFNIRKFDHVTPFFKELNWLKMDSRRTLHLCTFVVKIINNPAAPLSIKERLIFRRDIHEVNIRNGGELTMPHHRTAIFRRGFSYNAVKGYNSLPTELLNLGENAFKHKYREYLLMHS